LLKRLAVAAVKAAGSVVVVEAVDCGFGCSCGQRLVAWVQLKLLAEAVALA